MSEGVDVLVRVIVRPVKALGSTPAGILGEAAVALVIAWALIEAAATILLVVKVLVVVLLAAVVLALAYMLGRRRGGHDDGWRPVDTGYRVSTAPAVVEGRRCAPCGRIYRAAVAAVDGPAGRIYVCRDHAASEQLHAITRGGAR